MIRLLGVTRVMINDTPSNLVLVVDDIEINREIAGRLVTRLGHRVVSASDGAQALGMLETQSFDLMLLDIMMPVLNGYAVLERMQAEGLLRQVPVIVVSALDEIASVARCIELGAEDYLLKPINPILLEARINACLEKKRIENLRESYLRAIQEERERAERLLLNVFPRSIAEWLKEAQLNGQAALYADSFAEVTVLFADIVDFSRLTAQLTPQALIDLLNEVFSLFDRLAEQYGLEKIKTIGDAYMAVAGLPRPRRDHAEAAAAMALAMQNEIAHFNQAHGMENGDAFTIRIGMHSGPVVAGVIGTKKLSYDLWGETVNLASRMESQGLPGHIQTSAETCARLAGGFVLEERGSIQVKGKGEMTTYFLRGRRVFEPTFSQS